MHDDKKPYILGIGGSRRSGSNTSRALSQALRAAANLGAETRLFDAEMLNFPLYSPELGDRSSEAKQYVDELRRADGFIIASPSYHGSVSGLVKNALDYVQDLANDEAVYLSGRAVGLITTGAGLAGAVNALTTMRNIVHALRGWPTPLGVPVAIYPSPFGEDGSLADDKLTISLATMAAEVVDFAKRNAVYARHRLRNEGAPAEAVPT